MRIRKKLIALILISILTTSGAKLMAQQQTPGCAAFTKQYVYAAAIYPWLAAIGPMFFVVVTAQFTAATLVGYYKCGIS